MFRSLHYFQSWRRILTVLPALSLPLKGHNFMPRATFERRFILTCFCIMKTNRAAPPSPRSTALLFVLLKWTHQQS